MLIFGLLLFPSGCKDEPDPLVLTRMVIHSSNGTKLGIIEEEITALSVRGYDQNDNSFKFSSEITWSVNNGFVSVDNRGFATPISAGVSTISAEIDRVTASIDIKAWDSSAPRIEIYVSDVGVGRQGPHQIIKYDEDGSHPEVFIRTGLSTPQDIVFVESQGFVLISNYLGNNIKKFDIETGNYIEDFAYIPGGPTRIDIGPDRLLYVVQWLTGGVLRYNLDGTLVDSFTIEVFNAIGMDWDNSGNLYVSSFNGGSNGFVQKFDKRGSDQGNFISRFLQGPTDIWFDGSGNLLVSDWNGNNVQKFAPDGTYIGTFITGVIQPEGVAILDNGKILVGASGTGSVKMYESNGNFIMDLIEGGGILETPNAVVIRKVNY